MLFAILAVLCATGAWTIATKLRDSAAREPRVDPRIGRLGETVQVRGQITARAPRLLTPGEEADVLDEARRAIREHERGVEEMERSFATFKKEVDDLAYDLDVRSWGGRWR